MLYIFAILAVVVLGAVLWNAWGAADSAAGSPRTIGPDDDPDFLRGLTDGSHPRPDSETDSQP